MGVVSNLRLRPCASEAGRSDAGGLGELPRPEMTRSRLYRIREVLITEIRGTVRGTGCGGIFCRAGLQWGPLVAMDGMCRTGAGRRGVLFTSIKQCFTG